MLPLVARVLPLWKIAEYWSRELGDVRPSDEIFHELLSSFWRDVLYVTGSSGAKKVDRRAILKVINRSRLHPGFTLVEETPDHPRLEKSPAGTFILDITKYVVLPADDAAWTDALSEAAYEQMAEMSVDDFDALVKPGFRGFCTTREGLRSYCDAMGYPLPRFWFGADRSRRRNTRREGQARAWLRQITRAPKQKTKSSYFVDAQKEFPGIPRKAFNRIWKDVVPATWTKSGPVRKAQEQTRI
jgi:hypothetical protein